MGYCDWLLLNPHLHGVFLDGVFIEQGDGELRFAPLPELSEPSWTARERGLAGDRRARARPPAPSGTAVRRPPDDHNAVLAAQDADGEQLVLSALGAAASFGNDLAGPESRPGRVPYLQETSAQPRTESPLCAAYGGFSLHANTRVHAGDKPGVLEAAAHQVHPAPAGGRRAPRAHRRPGGRTRSCAPEARLKRAFGDGTWAIEMDELSLVARLAALVPPPWQNQVRYSGVLATASKWRSRIVPKPPAEPTLAEPTLAEQPPCVHGGLASELELDRSAPHHPLCTVPKGNGCRYWPWRLLKARTFGEPTTKCSHCEGELTLRALVQDPGSIRCILSHLGLPTEVPKPAPARGPPYYQARVRRLRHSDPQQDLPS